MPAFVSGSGSTTPFGRNEFLRSTKGTRTESYTLAADSVPTELIDGVVQRILQPGTVLAKITSGVDAGKVGPFQAGGTKEVQTLTESGTISGGTFDLTFGDDTLADIPYDVTAAALQADLNELASIQAVGGVVVTGGPIGTTPFTLTYGDETGADIAEIVADATNLTGSTPGITEATSTPGAAGAVDGRQTSTNIVGLAVTFLPWQLLDGDDREVAVYTDCVAVQAWCFEYNAAGERVALTNTTADYLRGTKRLQINFA